MGKIIRAGVTKCYHILIKARVDDTELEFINNVKAIF